MKNRLNFTDSTDPFHRSHAKCIAFSSDGSLAAVGYQGGRRSAGLTNLWDARSGERLIDLDNLRGDRVTRNQRISDTVYQVSFSPDCQRILERSYDKLLVWPLLERERLSSSSQFKQVDTLKPVLSVFGYFSNALFSPDGRYIVGGEKIGAVRVWDAKDGREILRRQVLPMIPRPFHAVSDTTALLWIAYSPDGKYIVASSADGTIRFLNASSLEEVTKVDRIVPGEKLLDCGVIAFSPDGNWLGYGLFEHAAIWSLERGELVHSFESQAVVIPAWDSKG